MATIANLNVKLTCGISGFAASMKEAGKKLSDFSAHVDSTAKRIAGWGGALTALATGGGVVALMHSQMEAIDVAAKLSDRLGTTTEAITGLQYAADLAGVQADALTNSLGRMQKMVGDTIHGVADTTDVFGRLGISAKSLANMPMDTAFGKIADSLSHIHNAAERAQIEMTIFGRSGAALDPLLTSGASGIAAAQKQAQKLGLTLSRIDAAKVEAANDAMTAAQAVFKGAARTLAVQVAPYIQAVADRFTQTSESAGGMGSTVSKAFQVVVSATAKTADTLELLEAGWQTLRGVAGTALLGIIDPLNLVIKGVDWLINKLTGSRTAFAAFSQSFDDALNAETQEAFDKASEHFRKFQQGVNSTAASRFFSDLTRKADQNAKAIAAAADSMRGASIASASMGDALRAAAENAKHVADSIAGLQKQVAQLGMTDAEKKLDDLARASANLKQLAQAKSLLAKIDAQNYTQGLAQKAQRLIDSIKSPLEIYNGKMSELKELLDRHLISGDQFRRLKAQTMSELYAPQQQSRPAFPDAIGLGSAAAARFQFEQSRGVADTSLIGIEQNQLKSQQNSEEWLRRIEALLRSPVKAAAETVFSFLP